MNRLKHISYRGIKICWGAAGFALFAAGLHVVNVPDGQLLSVAGHLGAAMLFAGLINLFIYFRNKNEIHDPHWLLADGMSTALLSVFPLFNKMIIPMVIPFFFGIWELFSGILKFIESTELHREQIKGWDWFLGIGMIELISGVASMIKPIDDFVGMNHVIAIILFVQSSGYMFKILIYHHLTESEKTYIEHNK